jgi:hypothetical protein
MNARVLTKLLFGAIAIASAVHAQELLKNSTFDTDKSDWITDSAELWNSFEDHTAATASSGTGGSLQISTQSSNQAEQCVQVQPDTLYVLDAWIKKDNGTFGPCADPAWDIRLQWWGQPDCSMTGELGAMLSSPADIPTEWSEQQMLSLSPPMSHGAKVLFTASCPSHRNITTIYFDDVSLKTDAIFVDTFESHPTTGPSEPGD